MSVRNCAPELELVTVQQSGPFGTHAVTTQRAQVDARGRTVERCSTVGLDYYRKVLGLQPASSEAAMNKPFRRCATWFIASASARPPPRTKGVVPAM